MTRVAAHPSQLIDWIRDAVRVRRGPLPAPLKQRVLEARRRLFFRSLFPPAGECSCRIDQYRVTAFSFENLSYLFRELFVDLDYFFESRTPQPRIVDCGSNIGFSVLFFKLLYPGATLTAFEPASQSFEMLRRNVDANELANVDLRRAAVGSTDGTIEFYEDAAPGSLTASVDPKRATARPMPVDRVRLSRFIDGEIDFLKIDVEGAEVDVLEDLAGSGALSRVDQMAIEYHHHVDPSADRLGSFLAQIEAQGFGYQIRSYLPSSGTRRTFQDLLIRAYRKSPGRSSTA
jgi:FkbM family methyltransferase